MNELINSIGQCWVMVNEQMPLELVYYSHVFNIAAASIFGVYVLFKAKGVQMSLHFFMLCILFSLWVAADLITWTMLFDSRITMLGWSLMELLEILFFFLSANLVYLYLNSQLPNKWVTIILLAPVVSIFVLTLTGNILIDYNLFNCEATENEFIVNTFVLYSDIFYIIFILVTYFLVIIKEKIIRKSRIIFMSGTIFFLVFYLIVLYSANYSDNYNISLYALIGMPIFLIATGYSLVKFGLFNFKILSVNLLVSASIIVVAAQFLFIENRIGIFLNVFTVLVLSVSGVLLVRSVKRVDAQREELEIANQEQQTLVHFITHQIKGFFTKSRNIFDTLSDAENMPEGAQRLITEGMRSDKEGVELVENILNAANLKNGKLQFTDKPLDMNQLVKSILAEVAPSATAKNLKLNYYCSTTVPFVGDEFRLKDVIKNLISNSINYTFEGGITIYLNKKPDRIEFIVKDTGVGLTEDDKKKLFTSGGRGTESLKYNVSSTGYGLFIVQKIVSYYKGRIWAESEGRGKGSVFTLVLPLENKNI